MNWILLYLKGVCMGAADVVPGVSGGTIAFITGIYERFIGAIKSVNIANLKLFFTGKWKAFWKNIDGTFLLVLVAGILTSILTLAKVMTWLIDYHPILTWAFFFGLILASTIFVGKDVKWGVKTVIAFLVAAVLAFFITSVSPAETPNAWWFIMLSGALAICAMILPGISGSFILLLLGKYHYILSAVNNFDFKTIGLFVVGILVGITSFARVLSWMFKYYKEITLAALTGFMFGSLNKIWPWKLVTEKYVEGDGMVKIEDNVLPHTFEQVTGTDPQLFGAIGLLLFGFVLLFAIEFIANSMTKAKARRV